MYLFKLYDFMICSECVRMLRINTVQCIGETFTPRYTIISHFNEQLNDRTIFQLYKLTSQSLFVQYCIFFSKYKNTLTPYHSSRKVLTLLEFPHNYLLLSKIPISYLYKVVERGFTCT